MGLSKLEWEMLDSGHKKTRCYFEGRCSGLTNALSLYTQIYSLFALFV